MNLEIDEKIDKGLYYKKISNDKVINITGEGGSGKSTLANEYRTSDDYAVVDYDLVLLDPPQGTVEYELKQMLLSKYGKDLFASITEVGMDKVKENFTTIYLETLHYLSSKNKTIVLDGTQLRFIDDVKKIKGELVVLRPSLQTCVARSVDRFCQKHPDATPEEIQKYTQNRSLILHKLNPMMNELLTQVDALSDVRDTESFSDISTLEKFLQENAKKYLEIIKMEYGKFMSPEQNQFLQNLLTTDCVKVDLNGKEYIRNQENSINNSTTMTPFQKLQALREITVPLAHGGRVFQDDKIHFYPSMLLTKNPNMTMEQLKQKCDEVLMHELLHFFIRPEGIDVEKYSDLKGIDTFTTEGLVDMCTRDIQLKYHLHPNYNSEYGSNVIFIREALANIPDESERMKLIFNGSVGQIYQQTTTETYDTFENFTQARDKKTTYDAFITNISKIWYPEHVPDSQRFLYDFSANYKSKDEALEAIVNLGQQLFPEKAEMSEKEYATYQNIDRVKMALDKIIANDDCRSPIEANNFIQQYTNQSDYDIISIHQQLERQLKEKFEDYRGRESEFQRDCLYEYAAYIIPMIKQDYAPFLTPDANRRLDDLVTKKKIIVQETDKGCTHQDGRIEIEREDPLKPTFIKEVRYSMDVLLHEIFHQTHRFRVGEDLYYRKNGKEVKGINYGGYLFEEGLTDKCTIDFAKKHQLSCYPFYEYHLYTQLVDCVEKVSGCSNGELFNKDYRNVFNKIDATGNLLEQYRFAELSRFASQYVKHDDKDKIEIDFHGKTHEVQPYPRAQELLKSSFDQRSKDEIQVALQIRKKNQLIAKQKEQSNQLESSKTMVKGSSPLNGYADSIILMIMVILVASIIGMIMYLMIG